MICIFYIGAVDFPQDLVAYGLSERTLTQIYEEVVGGKKSPSDSRCLNVTPNVDFYQALHPYLKKWHITRKATKTTIGKLYLALDKCLVEKTDRPDNAYRFVDNLTKANYPSSKPVYYGCKPDIRKQFDECQKQLEDMKSEVSKLKGKLEASHHGMKCAHEALCAATTEKTLLQSKKAIAEKKVIKYREDNRMLQKDCEKLIEENLELSSTILDVRDELSEHYDDSEIPCNNCQTISNHTAFMAEHNHSCNAPNFTIETKHGRKYSPSIRKLYYSLLADGVPASSISNIVKSVVKCFSPGVDMESLVLPQRSCANYMCRDELRTISNAHKATVLSECGTEGFAMNTDGTTKGQRKLGGLALNNMTISVNELSDGSADQVIADISKEFATLRNIAHALNLPNADTINWTMITSSTSDSASTQKRLNMLIHKCKESDEKEFGKATIQTVELIESFCSMHLGVNLRKAFLSGVAQTSATSASCDRERHPVDVFVHEFCKLFGKSGCPEYGCGAVKFPDFLAIMSCDTNEKLSSTYYNLCASVTLDRQVGNRYFVTAANAAKILFLKDAAIDFLNYSGKSTGNKLEKDVYAKLHDETEITQLRVDALMFYHIYADLVMLSKSNKLKKSILDTNEHYLELKTFLQEIEQDPAIVLNKDHVVFKSELTTLYGEDVKVNHRLHTKAIPVHERLFDIKDCDTSVLYPMLAAGAAKMKEKLCMYAQQQLPGGRYWNPDNPIIKKQLSTLTPSNDLCRTQ